MHENRPVFPVHKKLPVREFGFLLAGVLFTIGIFPVFSGNPLRKWAILFAALALFLALAAPVTLSGATRLWLRLGDLLAMVLPPIALGLLFFVVFTPIGWLVRALGRRPVIERSFEPLLATYWIRRTPPGPVGASLKDPY